jgi:hypothetical protein
MGPIRPWLRAKRAAEWRAETADFLASMVYMQRWYGYPVVLGEPLVSERHREFAKQGDWSNRLPEPRVAIEAPPPNPEWLRAVEMVGRSCADVIEVDYWALLRKAPTDWKP